MNLPPVVKRPSQYTDEERAIAAGWILSQRLGTLQALASSNRAVEITNDYGTVNQRRYYQDCEQYSRFLLYWIGYETHKGKMYGEA